MALRPSVPKTVRVAALLGGLVLLLAAWTTATTPVKGPHSPLELAFLRGQIEGLDVQFGTYFVTAGRCAGCHGHDSTGFAMTTEEGSDVNVADDWRSSMMGNSGRDPFFEAKVEHEGLVNPVHKDEIEHGCLKCHAPMAVYEQKMLGGPQFTMANYDTSVFAHDGVSCLACHMQDPDSAGRFFSGELHFDSARVWGPYTQAQINPSIMEFFVGFTPDQGAHILDGRVCAGCHTLITETADLDGNFTGGKFTEQAMWQEYKNSVYFGTDQNCRSCHLPRIQDSVVLASGYIFLNGQSPFGKHHLAGGNTFMLKLLKEHASGLGIPATATQFDSTIARSQAQLRRAVQLVATVPQRTADTLFVDVALTNLIGHKFPSGYPSRRAFVQVIAVKDNGDTLFQSGRWDSTYELYGHDAGYEPHHDLITQGDQVQIYEMVMGDVNGNVTTTLHRASFPLKDNRLVPIGFSTSHPSYDTTLIAGLALTDPDFNHGAGGVEGNGGDIVHYHIPTDGYTGSLQVKTKVYYQPVPPLWNQEMFSYHGPRIDSFRTKYENADGTPELVAADSLMDVGLGVNSVQQAVPQVFPNPTRDGTVMITVPEASKITAYDASGKRVPLGTTRSSKGWRCTLPDEAGIYHIVITTPQGDRLLRVLRAE
ncbi:MAG: T9SS type A sorting domain-containing protein [Flavobacteriales bacterium]